MLRIPTKGFSHYCNKHEALTKKNVTPSVTTTFSQFLPDTSVLPIRSIKPKPRNDQRKKQHAHSTLPKFLITKESAMFLQITVWSSILHTEFTCYGYLSDLHILTILSNAYLLLYLKNQYQLLVGHQVIVSGVAVTPPPPTKEVLNYNTGQLTTPYFQLNIVT